jgi:MFS family permease
LGLPSEHLLSFTAFATILSGVAFVLASPLLIRVVTDQTMPLLSATAAVAIVITAFVTDPIQFLVLRVALSAIQAGIPPNLLSGNSKRKGIELGFLNSARFLGFATGPFLATSLLGDGEASKVLHMFLAMMLISLTAAVIIFFTHTKKALTKRPKRQLNDHPV